VPRYFFEIAYNGAAYNGWQKQQNAPSVQQTIEESLSKYTRSKVTVVGCGRTDTGVHAQRYFFHVDLLDAFDTEQLKFKANLLFPKSIAVYNVFEVS